MVPISSKIFDFGNHDSTLNNVTEGESFFTMRLLLDLQVGDNEQRYTKRIR